MSGEMPRDISGLISSKAVSGQLPVMPTILALRAFGQLGDVDGGVLLRVLSKRARTVGVNSLSSLSLLTCCHS
jgi:hypothetical protein